MPRPTLGVMTVYSNNNKQIEERPYFKKLTTAGKQLGIDVFVFTPEEVDNASRKILAQQYDPNASRWVRRKIPFPNVIYDRCRQLRSKRFVQLKRFRAQYPNLLYLNRPLTNKWKMHLIFQQNEDIDKHLPFTKLYNSANDLQQALKKYPLLFLKPIHGTGGRGIIRIQKTADQQVIVRGRNANRHIIKPFRISAGTVSRKLGGWNMSGRYIIQQGIDLTLDDGRVHDYRLLIQKNGSGNWEVTGCAGRIGAHRSVTSNLHGGGKAMPMEKLLKLWGFSDEKILSVRSQADQLAHHVAEHLERHFGSLCELALDLAIDRKGNIWLLEVNQKPSREVFQRIGEKATYLKAVHRPLEYALWLHARKRERKST